MQSGMMNADNSSQVLRGISQKRQNGILEVKFPERNLTVAFVGGRIVNAYFSDRAPVTALVDILISANLLDSAPDLSTINSYKELFLLLNERPVTYPALDENTYRRVVKQYVLDTLFACDQEIPGEYNFAMMMPEYDKDFCPSISVGQYLLDRVALESESERFQKLFPDNSKIIRLDTSGLVLTEEEEIIYNLIGEGISKEKLAAKALLSRNAFQNALLSMHERALIEVEIADANRKIDTAVSSDIISVLEINSERPFVESDMSPLHQEVAASDILDEIESEFLPAKKPVLQEEQPKVLDVEDEFSPEEEEYQEIRHGRIQVLNMRLLNSVFLPQAIIFVFLVVACLAPIYLWDQVWAAF